MNTFLPVPDFFKSARILDNKRLGKERVETLQILQTLAGLSNGWQNHPAVKMWRRCSLRLVEYGLVICDEWVSRGYKDTCGDKILSLVSTAKLNWSGQARTPEWFGDERFHNAHKAALLFKWMGSMDNDQLERFERYSQEWNIEPKIDYYWPI